MSKKIERLASWIEEGDFITTLTGAGMSVESGVAPFRGEGGLWEKFDAEEYASIDAFHRDPNKSWELFKLQVEEIWKAEPHKGHEVLLELEDHGLRNIITQNIDGLHQKAGSRNVLELHGSLMDLICLDCGDRYQTEEYLDEILGGKTPHCECGSVLKPDAVLFGEQIPQTTMEESIVSVEKADLMLVIGTSAVIQPAAGLPHLCKRTGGKVVEINIESTPLTNSVADLTIIRKAGEGLEELYEEL